MNSTLSHHSDATLITDYNSLPLNCQRELGFNTMWITKFVLRIPKVRNILKSFIRLFQRLFGRHKSLDSILCDNKVFFCNILKFLIQLFERCQIFIANSADDTQPTGS